MDFIVTHYCHTCWDAQLSSLKAVSRRAEIPSVVPGAEIGSKTKPSAPNSPWQYHSKRESPKVTLEEQKHWGEKSISIEIRTWIKNLLGKQTKVKQSKFTGITWDERMGRRKGNIELGERGGGLAWLEKYDKLKRSQRWERERSSHTWQGREGLKLKRRKSQEEGRESS